MSERKAKEKRRREKAEAAERQRLVEAGELQPEPEKEPAPVGFGRAELRRFMHLARLGGVGCTRSPYRGRSGRKRRERDRKRRRAVELKAASERIQKREAAAEVSFG